MFQCSIIGYFSLVYWAYATKMLVKFNSSQFDIRFSTSCYTIFFLRCKISVC